MSFQIGGLFLTTLIFAYQLFELLRAMNRLETQNRNMIEFANERWSITMQFLTFVVGFAIKVSFNVALILSSYSKESVEQEKFNYEVAWCVMLFSWTAVPISYQMFKNWQSFRKQA